MPFLSFLKASGVFLLKRRGHNCPNGSKHFKGNVKEEPVSNEGPQHKRAVSKDCPVSSPSLGVGWEQFGLHESGFLDPHCCPWQS